MDSRGGDKKAWRPSGSRPIIRTLADLNRRSGPGSNSDSDVPQEYYTGGEKSGMLVQDPLKRVNVNSVDAIFAQARQMGAIQGPVEPNQPSSSSGSFTGTGKLLSGETGTSTPTPQQPEDELHDIYFWTNGFTVNDGPLRRFDDPQNATFLESIMKSECPKELEPQDKRSMVHVNLIRRAENYTEPARPRTAFQGVGRTLASESSSNYANEAVVSTTPSQGPPSSPIGVIVDECRPSTTVQLRLADGTRMVARFNIHHTVSDIRSYIDASRPTSPRTYQLQMVGFPPKQLGDPNATIADAGLANSVVVQKL